MSGIPQQDKVDPVRSHILQVLCLSPCSSVEGGNPWSSWIKCFEFPGRHLFVCSSLREVLNPFTPEDFAR